MNEKDGGIPLLTIVRGLPGSGKSTYARELSAKTGAIVVEPDAMLVQNGEYKYDFMRYAAAQYSAHILSRKILADCLADCIYVDVLPTLDEVRYLMRFCIEGCFFEHSVFESSVIDMPRITYEESRSRNVHGVCEKDLKRMFAEWEDWK